MPARTNTIVAGGDASATAAIAANGKRLGWSIQNQGTNVLFVKLGASASTTDYTFTLAAGTGSKNGTGGSVGQSGSGVWAGAISIAGTSPAYSHYELAED